MTTEFELGTLFFRFAIGFAFLAASLPKLVAPGDFRRALENYRLLPQSIVGPVATWLPRLEVFCAATLIAGIGIRYAAALAATLLLAFGGAVVTNLARGRRIDCGCYALSSPRRIGWSLVVRNLVLTIMAITLVANPPTALVLFTSQEGGDATGADAIAILVLATTAVLAELIIVEAFRLRSASRLIVNFESIDGQT